MGFLGNLWKKGNESRAHFISFWLNVLASAVFLILQFVVFLIWHSLNLLDLVVIGFVIIQLLANALLVSSVRQHMRAAPTPITPVAPVTNSNPLVERQEMAGAYIMLQVRRGTSQQLVEHLSTLDEVKSAAAVWGQWDVVARVNIATANKFMEFLNDIQGLPYVRRTETQLTRTEQPVTHPDDEPISRDDDVAFLLLKVDALNTTEVLNRICANAHESGMAKVEHAAGILGTYDVALTVHYSDDRELANFVMKFCQGQYSKGQLEAETVTMPAIRRMTFIRGKKKLMQAEASTGIDGRGT